MITRVEVSGFRHRSSILEHGHRLVPVVPVRELEAWLLVDPEALVRTTNAGSAVLTRWSSQET